MGHTEILSNSGSQLDPAPPRANMTVQQSTENPNADSKRPSGSDSIGSRFGSFVGGYEIQAELGRGGMGIVFRAFDPDLKRSIALKILSAGASASIDELIRFRGEAELVAKLQHPNIVQIYEIGQHDNFPFLALEYVDGGTLGKVIAGQPQPPRKAADWVEVLARAVHVAHLEGIIHRDLKPQNVLMTKSGMLKVTDFGLAKNLDSSVGLSHDGQLMGTPSYMAPEQAAGNIKLIGPRTDVYALGAILYELLTGRPPFRGATILDTLEQVRQVEPASPSRLVPKLPRELCTICLKCLEKAPERRYESALELAEDLHRFIDGERIKAKPIPFWKRTARNIRRRPFLAAQVIIAVLVIGLVALGVVLYRERNLQDEIEVQRRETAAKQLLIERNRAELLQSSGEALDAILAKLADDEKISKLTDLEPLHQELFNFYERLLKDSTSEGEPSTEALKRLATAYRKLAELTNRSGKKEIARQAFGRSRDFFKRLQTREPENATWKRELASVLLDDATIAVRDFKQLIEARASLLEARELLRSVLDEKRDDLQSLNRLAETHHMMAELLDAENESLQAIAEYRKAIELRHDLRDHHEKHPEFKRDLARDYGYLGDVQVEVGRMSEADQSYWDSHELRGGLLSPEEVRKLPDDARFQLARSWQNLATFQLELRCFDTAIGFAKKSLELRTGLVGKNAADKLLSLDLAQCQKWLAELYLQKAVLTEDPLQRKRSLVAGLEPLTAALKRYEELYDFDRLPVTVLRGRAEVHLLLARWKLLETPPDLQEAGKSARIARDALHLLTERQGKDGSLYFLFACAASMELEASTGPTPGARSIVMRRLKEAEQHKLQKNPLTIRDDRALKLVQGDAEFETWMEQYTKSYFQRRDEKAKVTGE